MDRINAAFTAARRRRRSRRAWSASCCSSARRGKSAQIPLHVWLPDAMAGPTPVSALIHAATMVTAGVYLVARMSRHLPARAGGVAGDRRHRRGDRVLRGDGRASCRPTSRRCSRTRPSRSSASCSWRCGVGAYGVAIFHLYTHAFFKACLFLGAGSVIHALGGEQDIRKMGGLARKIPLTFVTFAIATAAIAGIPPLAGFFSKDEILWFAFASERGGSPLLWARRRGDRAADRVLHVPPAVAHVLRPLAHGRPRSSTTCTSRRCR